MPGMTIEALEDRFNELFEVVKIQQEAIRGIGEINKVQTEVLGGLVETLKALNAQSR